MNDEHVSDGINKSLKKDRSWNNKIVGTAQMTYVVDDILKAKDLIGSNTEATHYCHNYCTSLRQCSAVQYMFVYPSWLVWFYASHAIKFKAVLTGLKWSTLIIEVSNKFKRYHTKCGIINVRDLYENDTKNYPFWLLRHHC